MQLPWPIALSISPAKITVLSLHRATFMLYTSYDANYTDDGFRKMLSHLSFINCNINYGERQ